MSIDFLPESPIDVGGPECFAPVSASTRSFSVLLQSAPDKAADSFKEGLTYIAKGQIHVAKGFEKQGMSDLKGKITPFEKAQFKFLKALRTATNVGLGVKRDFSKVKTTLNKTENLLLNYEGGLSDILKCKEKETRKLIVALESGEEPETGFPDIASNLLKAISDASEDHSRSSSSSSSKSSMSSSRAASASQETRKRKTTSSSSAQEVSDRPDSQPISETFSSFSSFSSLHLLAHVATDTQSNSSSSSSKNQRKNGSSFAPTRTREHKSLSELVQDGSDSESWGSDDENVSSSASAKKQKAASSAPLVSKDWQEYHKASGTEKRKQARTISQRTIQLVTDLFNFPRRRIPIGLIDIENMLIKIEKLFEIPSLLARTKLTTINVYLVKVYALMHKIKLLAAEDRVANQDAIQECEKTIEVSLAEIKPIIEYMIKNSKSQKLNTVVEEIDLVKEKFNALKADPSAEVDLSKPLPYHTRR